MTSKISIARRVALAVAAMSISVAAAGSAAAADRHVNVVNSTGRTLTHFYASNVNDPNFHGDILGTSVLRAGGVWRVNFDDGSGACVFDIRAKFSDGEVKTWTGLNVCTATTLTINGR
jgi:hypothetical protein